MKYILFLAMALPLMFASCSSNDGESDNNDVEYLKGTSWEYHSLDSLHEIKNYENTENKHQLDEMLQMCPSLEYTVGEKNISEDEIVIDLCDKQGHKKHIEASLDFIGDSCVYNEQIYRFNQVVKIHEETCSYKFKAGTYIGSYGISYVGITVKEYGIYRSSESGEILVLPLDGNFNYVLSKKNYKSSQNIEVLSDSCFVMSYYTNGNQIIFENNNVAWEGVLDHTQRNMTFKEKETGNILYTFSVQN